MFTPVPTILAGKYRLIGELGRGGMGTVWRAEHLTLRSHVAIKLLGAEIARYPEAMERFLREAQAAAALRSPHVVQVLDYGEDQGVAFIAMELLEGESLGTRLRRVSQLSAEETSKLLGQVARALQRAHEAQIVHRDLKPDNIFIVKDQDNELAKVLDFGIAKSGGVATHQTKGGVRLGTPDYMSPEQVSASSALDYRADLWAFGVIAFECLTGKHPFERQTPEQLFYAICSAPLPVPSEHGPVPRGFDAWFMKACARDPAARFTSAMDAAAELSAACSTAVASPRGRTQIAAKKPAPVKVHRSARQLAARRRLWTGLAVAAGLISIAGAGFLIAQEHFGNGAVAAPGQNAAPEPAPSTGAPPVVLVVTQPPSWLAPSSAPELHPEPISPPELNPVPVVGAPAASVEAPRSNTSPSSITQCFKACDGPARDCERSCKAPNCNVASTCFRVEAECDLNCYKETVATFQTSPPARCQATCGELDQRCRSRTCGGSPICAKERCEPVRKDCNRSCSAAKRDAP